MFLKDATNEQNSEPTRIEAFFEAAFHLIEAVAAEHRIHVNKHKLVRDVLKLNKEVFGEDTEKVWRAFQEIENQIWPGQAYGGAINGEALERTRELVEVIRGLCEKRLNSNSVLRKASKRNFS
jgi:phenylpyruvate tautomerase PptA (4-oxalocrotonate tautomerase family)